MKDKEKLRKEFDAAVKRYLGYMTATEVIELVTDVTNLLAKKKLSGVDGIKISHEPVEDIFSIEIFPIMSLEDLDSDKLNKILSETRKCESSVKDDLNYFFENNPLVEVLDEDTAGDWSIKIRFKKSV